MKKIIFILLASMSQSLFAQHNVGGSFQGNILLKKPKSVDVTMAGGASAFYGHRFDFKGEWSVNPELALLSSRYVMDGLFFDHTGENTFEVTPSNFKQSSLEVLSLRMPIIINKKLIGDDRNAAFLGFGPYFEYTLIANQKYRIGEERFNVSAPMDKRFQYGFQYEMGIKKSSQFFKNGVYLSFGLMYQMSEILEQNDSYKLFATFAKFSVFLN